MNARTLGVCVALATLLFADVGHADWSACASARRRPSLDDQIRLYTLCITGGQVTRANLAYAFGRRAYAFIRKGDLDRALEDLNQSLSYDPNGVDPYQWRGFIHSRRLQWDLAEQDFTAVIERTSRREQAEAYMTRGAMRSCRGICADGLRDFDQALAVYPKLDSVHGIKAWVLSTCPDAAVRNGEEAVRLAQRALSLRSDWVAHATLAAALAEAGQFADSVHEVSLAQTLLKMKDPVSRRLLAEQRALYETGRPYREPIPDTNCFPTPGTAADGTTE